MHCQHRMHTSSDFIHFIWNRMPFFHKVFMLVCLALLRLMVFNNYLFFFFIIIIITYSFCIKNMKMTKIKEDIEWGKLFRKALQVIHHKTGPCIQFIFLRILETFVTRAPFFFGEQQQKNNQRKTLIKWFYVCHADLCAIFINTNKSFLGNWDLKVDEPNLNTDQNTLVTSTISR